MDFDFSEDQQSLRDAVQRWVERDFGFERRHALAKAGGASREVHAELAALGLTGLQVPEAHGGLGMGPVEAMVVMEELGRGLVPAPWAQAALIAPTLLAAAPQTLQAEWLPRIAEGSALVVLAHQERAARYRLAHVQTRARREGDTWRLEGAKTVVPAGDEADAWIVPARIEGGGTPAVVGDATEGRTAAAAAGGTPTADSTAGIGLFLVAAGAEGTRVRGYPTQDGARAADLAFDGAPAELLVEEGYELLERAADVGIAAACAEAVGLMDRLLAVTVDYMNTRKQFGVPIASFQALRHRIADVKMQLELARSMSYFASLRLGDETPVRRRAVSQAKVQLGQSMRFVGQQCVQLHGGIGVTDEYVGSHYFKRLTMLEFAFGDTPHHLGEVSERMQDTAGVFA